MQHKRGLGEGFGVGASVALAAAVTAVATLGLGGGLLASAGKRGPPVGELNTRHAEVRLGERDVTKSRNVFAGDVVRAFDGGLFELSLGQTTCRNEGAAPLRAEVTPEANVLLQLRTGRIVCYGSDPSCRIYQTGPATIRPCAVRTLTRSSGATAVLIATRTTTVVKVTRGYVFVSGRSGPKREVLVARNRQVVVPAGRDPAAPTRAVLTAAEAKTVAIVTARASLPPLRDVTPPIVTIKSAPDGEGAGANATFTFVGSEPNVVFACSLDGAPFHPCASPTSYPPPPLAAGGHTFRVTATDAAGNTGPADAFSWTVAAGPGAGTGAGARRAQTIAFAALEDRTPGDSPFVVSATASSGLLVTFSSTPITVCVVNTTTAAPGSALVTLVGTGTCTIRADQAGNASYSAAPTVSRSFEIARQSQTIAFAALPDKAPGDPTFVVSANASSGLPVTFSSTPITVCVTNDTTTAPGSALVMLVGTGTCTIRADQGGNARYEPAPAVSRSFDIAKQPQTITFAPLPDRSAGSTPFVVSATASSGLPVTFSSTTITVCVVNTTTAAPGTALVTLVGTGTCTIRADQTGNASHLPAPTVSRSFSVG